MPTCQAAKLRWHFSAVLVTCLSCFFLAGCFAPVNLTYDSATMLDQREIEVQGGGSYYSEPESGTHLGNYFHLKFGYGFTEKYNMKLRLEYLDIPDDWDIQFIEVENKFRLNNNIAASVPVGFYTGWQYLQADPRIYFTYTAGKHFAVTGIPKCHILFADGFAFLPGVSANVAFSSNLDRWAFRFEAGYDQYFSVGGGLSFYFHFKQNDKPAQPVQ